MHSEHECVNSEIGDGGEEFMWQKVQILKYQFLTQVVSKPGELTVIYLGISCIGGFSTCFSFLMINGTIVLNYTITVSIKERSPRNVPGSHKCSFANVNVHNWYYHHV
jgi:hypothetical protein